MAAAMVGAAPNTEWLAGLVKRVASSVGEGSVVISKLWEFVNR